MVLLLLANMCVAAYAYLGEIGRKPDSSVTAVKADRIKLLTPQQVAALGPGKIAQLNITCAEFGPFTEREKTAVLEALSPLQLGKTLSQQRAEIGNGFWISVATKPGKASTDRALKELENLGFADVASVSENGTTVVSAGVYRSEELANARLAELERKGIKTARVLPRETPISGTLFVVREPQQSTVTALEAAKAKLPSANLTFNSCRDRPA